MGTRRDFYWHGYHTEYLFVTAIAVLLAFLFPLSSIAQNSNSRATFHDDKVSFAPARGWVKVDREDALIGYSSPDQTGSIFFSLARNDGSSTLDDVLGGAVIHYEEAFTVHKKSEYTWGKIKGPTKEWSAVFVTLELEWEGKPKNLFFRFYLTMFETDSDLYLIQASVQKPLKKDREKEILAMIRSVVAAP